MWQILEDRLRENSLTTRKFEVQPDDASQQDTANTAASSSSSAAAWLEGDSDLNKKTASPEQSPEFSEPPFVSAEGQSGIQFEDEEGDPDESAKQLEERMKRWVEMVESVDMLEKIDWLHNLPCESRMKASLQAIFEQGMIYCRDFMDGVLLPWRFEFFPLNPRAWLGEMERTLRIMAKKGCLPYWLKRPSDRNIRNDAAEAADGFSDPGNYDLDIVVHCLRLWRYCEGSRANMVMKQSISEYGSAGNKSAKGPVNLRGNIVEAMTKDLQRMGSRRRSGQLDYDPYKYWFEQDHLISEPGAPHSQATNSHNAYGWYQDHRGKWRRG